MLRIVDRPESPFLGDISHFANYDYEQKEDVELNLRIGFGHTFFPADYRSMAAIEEEVQT